VTGVRYFRAAPLGVHACFRRHTLFNPSSCNTFAACIETFFISCVEYTTLLHNIHGSVNALCLCDPHSSIVMLMCSSQFVCCQQPSDLWKFRLCLVERQCVESLHLHLTYFWRISHTRNGPNLVTHDTWDFESDDNSSWKYWNKNMVRNATSGTQRAL